MEILASFGQGLLVVLEPQNLFYCFVGVFGQCPGRHNAVRSRWRFVFIFFKGKEVGNMTLLLLP